MSLKQRILNYIRLNSNRNVTTREIEMRALDAGYSSTNGKRRAQELAQEGLIERVGTAKCAAWRAK